MRLLVVGCVILMLASVAARGQSAAEEREKICKTVVCREATTVKLKVSDKESVEFDFPRSPFVAEGFINLLSGEKLAVEFEEKDGQLTNARYVKETVHPERTISVELSQTDEGTVLKISNPFPKPIVYECMIQHYKQEDLSGTNVIPVGAKLVSFEMWPYPIAQAVLSNVHYQSTKASN